MAGKATTGGLASGPWVSSGELEVSAQAGVAAIKPKSARAVPAPVPMVIYAVAFNIAFAMADATDLAVRATGFAKEVAKYPLLGPLSDPKDWSVFMIVLKSVKSFFMLPIWLVQLGTGAKSFLDNPLIGSKRLNRRGLHRARVALAGAICAWRRRRLARHVRPDWREAFDRDGFVIIPDFVPPETFAAFRQSILDHRGHAREMIQGDAVTRRLAVDPEMLAAIPELRRQLDRSDLRALFHYVASFRVTPLHYVQTIVTHHAEQHVDPQEALHADAFHSSLKAWLFLNPVAGDEAPFTYVRGSHRLTKQRMDWEYRRSLADPSEMDRLSGRGSPRVTAEELAEMGLADGEALAVPGNTLVVADTIGFHARGASVRPIERVEIWSYARRNPFLPWLGGDPLSLPGLAERRVQWVWAARDRLAKWIGQPWQPVGLRTPTTPPQQP